MHQLTLCIRSPELKSRLRAAAMLMQASLQELSLARLLEKGASPGHWVLLDHDLEDIAKVIRAYQAANLKPENHIIRFIDKPWQDYVYHDIPIFASIVVPADPLAAMQILERLMRTKPLDFSVAVEGQQASDSDPFAPRFCTSPPMKLALAHLQKLKSLPVDTVLLGPTGAGKDTAARWLHTQSGLRGEFVHVNCAALPEQLFEAELFGVVAGAYTGAQKNRMGKLEQANEGTLYLDEIDSLSLTCQAKLLTALQYRGASRLGGNDFYSVNVRVIASTKQAFTDLMAKGLFREDLHYRLSVTQVLLPALKERLEDILPLYQHFLQEACARFKLSLPALAQEDCDELLSAPWSGNVRELQAVAQRHAMGLETPSQRADKALGMHPAPASLRQRLMAFERAVIQHTLAQSNGCAKTASLALGIPLHSMYYRLKRLETETELNLDAANATQTKDV
ncbi:MAG TPA: sigma 54-interacting transcriptional regulator [Limnobacter sp.]|nr:sigma 54-interacting transcriptional regulator [Limnobacter sp.]